MLANASIGLYVARMLTKPQNQWTDPTTLFIITYLFFKLLRTKADILLQTVSYFFECEFSVRMQQTIAFTIHIE